MRAHKLGLAALLLAAACSSGLDPAREPGRAACHIEANRRAEEAWNKACLDERWADCPEAQQIVDQLEADLAACDAEAYPDAR